MILEPADWHTLGRVGLPPNLVERRSLLPITMSCAQLRVVSLFEKPLLRTSPWCEKLEKIFYALVAHYMGATRLIGEREI